MKLSNGAELPLFNINSNKINLTTVFDRNGIYQWKNKCTYYSCDYQMLHCEIRVNETTLTTRDTWSAGLTKRKRNFLIGVS